MSTFPLSARYIDPLGIPFLGMTGKFHTHWGEVGGYKHPQALIYEVGAMLAQGARVSIGDHLHPSGQLETSTLRLVDASLQVCGRSRGVGGRFNQPSRYRDAFGGGG